MPNLQSDENMRAYELFFESGKFGTNLICITKSIIN